MTVCGLTNRSPRFLQSLIRLAEAAYERELKEQMKRIGQGRQPIIKIAGPKRNQ
jgi:hypothetical protein